MHILKAIAYAGIAFTGYQIYKAMKPASLQGGDMARPETPLVGYNPATSAPSLFGAGTIWQAATAVRPDPYASRVAWAPFSNGYGWNGDFYPVSLR